MRDFSNRPLVKLGQLVQVNSLSRRGKPVTIPFSKMVVKMGPCRVCSRLSEHAAQVGTCQKHFERIIFGR